VLVIIISF